MVMKSKNIQNTGKKRFDIMNTTDSESWLRRKGGNMMKMKKQMACLLAAVTVFSMTGCGRTFDSQEKTAEKAEERSTELPKLRVAAMPTITSLPTYYIQKNGLDEAAGFKMEVIMFDTGAPMNEALAADLWDVGHMGAAAVTGMANYDELIIGEVLESTDGQGVFVSPDSPVAGDTGYNPSFPTILGSPESVSGITILAPVGTAQHFTVLKWLEKLGMEASDVNIVNMDTVQAYQALQAGQGDAASLNVPTFFDAKSDGMVQVANLADMGTRYVDMIVGNRKSLDGKSDLIQKYVDCVLDACEDLQNDPDMAADLFVEFLQDSGIETSRDHCVADLKRVKWMTKEDWKGRELGNFARELGEFYVAQGQLEASATEKFNTNIISTFVESYQ